MNTIWEPIVGFCIGIALGLTAIQVGNHLGRK